MNGDLGTERARFRRVLITLDGSLAANLALGVADPLFRSQQPEVFLLGIPSTDSFDPTLRDHLDHETLKLHRRGLKVRGILREGDPGREILRFQKEMAIDLTIMSTHGQKGWKSLALGSVTKTVIRQTEGSVLTCRSGAATSRWNRIMVTLDGSDGAESILPEAAGIAKFLGAPLDVVSVVPQALGRERRGEFPTAPRVESRALYLETVCARLLLDGVDAHPIRLEGRPASQILIHAARSGTGLISMAISGRAGPVRIFPGSVAEEVLRNAPCPVLVRQGLRAEPLRSARLA